MILTSRNQLPDLMRELKLPMIACECGVAEGLLSEVLLKGGIEKLYLVDRWQSFPEQVGDGSEPQSWHDKNLFECRERLRQWTGGAIFLQGDTTEMAASVPDNSLGMVYIDADHSYNGVRKDLETWYPKLVPGGIIAGHDYLNPDYGANKAVNEFAEGRSTKAIVIPENEPNNASFYFIKTHQ